MRVGVHRGEWPGLKTARCWWDSREGRKEKCIGQGSTHAHIDTSGEADTRAQQLSKWCLLSKENNGKTKERIVKGCVAGDAETCRPGKRLKQRKHIYKHE